LRKTIAEEGKRLQEISQQIQEENNPQSNLDYFTQLSDLMLKAWRRTTSKYKKLDSFTENFNNCLERAKNTMKGIVRIEFQQFNKSSPDIFEKKEYETRIKRGNSN